MKLGRYPKYKPSGVEWLGDVPEQWEVKRLKYSATINDEVLSETTDPSFDIFYVDISSVDSIRGITSFEEMVFEDAPSRARRIVQEGDTVVSTVRTYLRAIATIRNPRPNTIVSTGFAVLRPRKVEPRFISYALRESSFVEAVVARSVGVSYPAINASEIGTIPIPLPSSEEQNAIADFLDCETSKIDMLVAKKQTLIERLKEKRTALISRTVTKGLPPEAARAAGLNPYPKLKPSGVEWLGDIPEHWNIWKVTHAFRRIGSGTTPKSDDADCYDGNVSWVTTSELRECVIMDTSAKITDAAIRNYPTLRLYPKGTLLFAMYGATIGRLGILGIPATVNQACAAFADPLHLDTIFTYYWLQMRRPTLIVLSAGGGQPNLSQDDLRQIRIPAPSLEDQHVIVKFLDRETAKIDQMVAKVETAIERLLEYRMALITTAVTGKIDVHETVPHHRSQAPTDKLQRKQA